MTLVFLLLLISFAFFLLEVLRGAMRGAEVSLLALGLTFLTAANMYWLVETTTLFD